MNPLLPGAPCAALISTGPVASGPNNETLSGVCPPAQGAAISMPSGLSAPTDYEGDPRPASGADVGADQFGAGTVQSPPTAPRGLREH